MKDMSKYAKAKLNAFNAEQKDWYATCPKCGEELKGTLKDIREHVCGSKAS